MLGELNCSPDLSSALNLLLLFRLEDGVSGLSAFGYHVLSGGTWPYIVGYVSAHASLTLGSLLSGFIRGPHYLVTVDTSVTVIGLDA